MDPLSAILNVGSKIIDKIFPDKDAADRAKIEMLKLQQEGAFKELEMDFELAKGQQAINVEEAKSSNLFVSGGRPAAMWVCVLGLFYTFILQPLLAWVAAIAKIASPPIIDTNLLVQLLVGMLGLAGIRGYEKVRNVASK